MTSTREQLSALRRSLAEIEKATGSTARPEKPASADGLDRVALDYGVLDAAAGGGLLHAALHELVGERQADAAPARALAAVFAVRAAQGRTIVWIGQDDVRRELGALSPDGLNAAGIDPARILLVQARDAVTALRAAVEAARCPAAGAVVSEIWGDPKALDLNATRRLMLSAQQSGIMVVLARLGVTPQPSAAETRWRVEAAASEAFPANAPGRPAFKLNLLRHRHGVPDGPWLVEWNSDDRLIHVQDVRPATASPTGAPLPGAGVAASGNGSPAPHAGQRVLRLAG